MTIWQRVDNIELRLNLGEYDEFYRGKKPKKDGKVTIYYPPGTSETIIVNMSQSNKYKISTKNFDEWYYYDSES